MRKLNIHRVDLTIGSLVVLLVIASSLGSFAPFEWLEKIIYGAEMRFSLPQSGGDHKLAIVNIDEKSIENIGPWPWPRHLIAEMISILKDNGARFIAIDLPLHDYEQNQGLNEIRRLHDTLLKRGELDQTGSWVVQVLADIEKRLDNDKRLVQAVEESQNVILPVFGHLGRYETELLLDDKDSYLARNALMSSDFRLSKDRFFPANNLTAPFPELAESSYGLGHLNFYPNELKKGQTHLLFFNYRGHVIPSMALRIALDYSGKLNDDAIKKGRGLWTTETMVPLDGNILVKFKGGQRSFPYYSFVDILKVKKVPAVFEDKIVLIGYTGEGTPVVNTPVDPQMPRVEFTANIIENLIRGRYLKKPGVTIYIEVLLILLCGIITTLILPQLDFLNRFAAVICLLFFTFIIGVISFMFFDIWLKTAYAALGVFFIYVSMFIRDIIVSQRSIDLTSKETMEMNRMLGLSFQSQGLLDLAFEKFRKCALDDSMKDVVYNLGLDYERKRMINKAIAVYEYINRNDSQYRDLGDRIIKLRKAIGALPSTDTKSKMEEKILFADDLEIKPTVGRYEILEELGQGAMGIVYKAKDPKINRLLAIKTIRFSDEFEEEKVKEVKERFLKEAEIAGKLSHPAIVSIYDVGEDYDLTYLAMEFLEGKDLRAYTQKENLLPLKKVLFIIHEVASGLDYAHSAGVVHRDVKPANIMLLKNGQVKVTDFGIAKAVSSSQTKSGVVLGTPNYMSPEQINGQTMDGRSDIFSLGIVFFELLTGHLPFQGKNLTNLLYQITQARHPSVKEINPKIPKPCEQIIDKALQKAPDQRFQTGGDLARYLRIVLDRMEQLRPR